MRPAALTKHRSRRRSGVGMSLFPFLAVLICTMGALILLLVVIARQARLQAAQTASVQTTQQQKQLREAREEVQWKTELLKESRDNKQSQLAKARLVLGHIEDHARRLGKKLTQLEATLAEQERIDDTDSQERAQQEAEIERVRAEIAEAKRQLDDARQAAQKRRRSYAIVPYRGPHETHRRPIYVECTTDAVILQPEEISLGESDFDGPMGPGNPLAAALRAAREYLLGQYAFDPSGPGEPYPLLLVRPSGIGAYYAARRALKSWGTEFGYELIGEDWRLDYRPPDPELARVVRRAIEAARRRQDRLARAAPRHHAGGTYTRYRASPTHGGIVPEGGLPVGNDRSGSRESAGAFGSGSGSRGTHPGSGVHGTSRDGTSSQARQPGKAGSVAQSHAASPAASNGAPLRSAAAGSTAFGGTGRRGAGSGDTGTAGSGAGGTSPGGTSIEGVNSGAASSGNTAFSGASSGSTMPAAAGAGGAGSPGMGLSTPSSNSMDPGNMRSGSLVGDASSADGSPGASGAGRAHSLAHRRGANWGLPDASAHSVPITRPIPVECHRDRLVIVPERGLRGGTTIPLAARTEASIDDFVSAVWEHMEGWGIAGNGMYWRPILKVHVAPDAQRRFTELAILLANSGLEVERRKQ